MAHIHEKIDFTVNVFVIHDRKVLLRLHDKYKIWLGVGGHIELDEDPNEAAIREVKEEVGLDIRLISPRPIPPSSDNKKELVPPLFLNIHPISENHQHVGMEYVAVAESSEVLPENPEDQWVWLSKEELQGTNLDIPEDIRFYALAALELADKS